MIVSKYLIHVLKEDSKNILTTWEKRASEEVSSNFGVTPLVLQTELDKWMDVVSEALEETNEGHSIAYILENIKLIKITPKTTNVSSDQALFEYHLFKEVLFEKLEKSLPVKSNESELILDILDHAVLSA